MSCLKNQKPLPPFPLYPYQVEGAKFIAKRRASLLYDEMGIGKSAQAVAACDLVAAQDILVICRAVARENWRREFEKFSETKRSCSIIYSRSDIDSLRDGITICSYEGLDTLLSFTNRTFDYVIVDEAHYVKEPGATRTKSVLGKTGAIHRGKQATFLTGTPTPNHAGEMWTTLYTLGRTRLSFDGFVERYCTSRITSYGRQITGTVTEPDRLAELRAMFRPIGLRRTKEDVNLELPAITYQDITVKPGKVDLLMCHTFRKYIVPVDRMADLEADMERELGVVKGIVNGGFTEEAMRALEANAKNIMTLRRYNSMQKVEPVVDLICDELAFGAYEKIVVFCIHRDTIMGIQNGINAKLGRSTAVTLFGGTPPGKAQTRIDNFQNSKNPKVFIAQLHCAGTSLTLTAAHQAMFVDLDWVPGNNEQAAARLHRIGQKKPVTVRSVSLAESIDGHIQNILTRKTREISSLTLSAMSGQPENLTINQLY